MKTKSVPRHCQIARGSETALVLQLCNCKTLENLEVHMQRLAGWSQASSGDSFRWIPKIRGGSLCKSLLGIFYEADWSFSV